MQYILYARKSTDDEDRQLLSIEAQLTELREFALKEGLCIHKELIEAKTAKDPGRPLFNSMLQALEAQEADGILAWHPDRLARNSVDGGKIIYLLDKGVIKDLKFPTYRLDNNAQGKFMLSIIFGQSKYYIDALSENIKRGIRQKLRNGIWPQRAPLGYLNDRKTRTIVMDKDKAPYIRKAFELYSTSEYSLSRLRDTINECGLTGTKNGILSISNYHFMLKNPIYYGLIKFNGEVYEGTHEPIITKKLFDKCQKVMEQRSKPHKKKPHYFIFRGLIRCGECGCMITAERQKGHIYYRCTKRVKQCSQKYIRQEQLSAQIQSAIQKVSISDDWADNIIRELQKDKSQFTQSSKTHLQNLEAQIKQIDNKISRLIDIYLEGHLALQEYQAKKAELIGQKKNIQEQIRDFSEAGNNWFEQAHSFITSLRQARYVAADGNLDSQKEFLQKIGSNFKIKERRLSFSTKSPFSLLAEGDQRLKWRRVKDSIKRVRASCSPTTTYDTTSIFKTG